MNKFKIWCTKTRRFIQNDKDFENRKGFNLGLYALKANGKVYFFECNEGGMEVRERKNVEVYFYTGLKDKGVR